MGFIHNHDDVIALRELGIAFVFGVAKLLDEGEDQALVLGEKSPQLLAILGAGGFFYFFVYGWYLRNYDKFDHLNRLCR